MKILGDTVEKHLVETEAAAGLTSALGCQEVVEEWVKEQAFFLVGWQP